VWSFVRVAAKWAPSVVPRRLIQRLLTFEGGRLFSRLPWLHPRVHPSRFAIAIGVFSGVFVTLAQLREGLPPSLASGLAVGAIFIFGELAAVLAGFALLGGYLGLGPPIRRRHGTSEGISG